MSIRPLYDRVVLRRIDSETQTSGGIVLPDSATDKPNQGEVLAVGPGAILESGETRAMTVKVGDRVLFSDYAPTEIKLDGEEVLILRESDILAILENTNTLEKAA